MPLATVIHETMSGWLKFDHEPARQPLRLDLSAYSDRLLSVVAPRPFQGEVQFGEPLQRARAQGTLTLHLTGPEYRINVALARYGPLHIAGLKSYRLSNPLASLTHCPLTVYQNGQPIGHGELAYREPIWRFPLTNVRVKRVDALPSEAAANANSQGAESECL